MRLVIIGPPGSGKGTQAELLRQEIGIAHLDIGELLRREIARGTAVGRRIKPIIARGAMVPEEIVRGIVERAVRGTRRGFALDGVPRTGEQAAFLDALVGIDAAIILALTDKAAFERISGRIVCPNGHDYHRTLKPPRREGICDACGLPLAPRADDTTLAILHRLRTYRRGAEPLITHYRGRLLTIDGNQPITKVHRDILKALRRLVSRRSRPLSCTRT